MHRLKIPEYESKLHKWLTNLSKSGSILVLLMHNLNPLGVLRSLSQDFTPLSEEIFSPENEHSRDPKNVTVKQILYKYNIQPSQAVFYDDYVSNIELVKQINLSYYRHTIYLIFF